MFSRDRHLAEIFEFAALPYYISALVHHCIVLLTRAEPQWDIPSTSGVGFCCSARCPVGVVLKSPEDWSQGPASPLNGPRFKRFITQKHNHANTGKVSCLHIQHVSCRFTSKLGRHFGALTLRGRLNHGHRQSHCLIADTAALYHGPTVNKVWSRELLRLITSSETKPKKSRARL